MLPVCMQVAEAHRERYVSDAWKEVCLRASKMVQPEYL